MTVIRWSALLVLTISVTSSSRAGDHIDPVWLEKLTTDGRAACQKYEAAARKIDELFQTRAEKLDKVDSKKSANFAEHTERLRFVRVGDNLLVERIRTNDTQPDKPRCSLVGLNAAYCFTLSQGRPDSPYTLASYSAEEKKRTGMFNAEFHVGLHRNAFHHLEDVLSGVDGSRNQKLVGIEWDEAKQAVRVVTTFSMGERVIREELSLDPARNWRMIEVRREVPSGNSVTTLTYGREVGGVMFPEVSQTIVKYTVADAPPNLRITSRLDSIRVAEQTEESFRLSAFGLPEPPGVEWRNPTPRYVWFLSAAGVFVALAVAFRYLARRVAVKVPT